MSAHLALEDAASAGGLTFEQLSDEAKERARDWWREGLFEDSWWDAVYDDAIAIASRLGLAIAYRGSEPAIYFKLWDQGAGASFEGAYSFVPDFFAKVTEYAPLDEELRRIAAGLAAVQAFNGWAVSASIKSDGRACHSRAMSIDVEVAGEEAPAAVAEEVSELLRAFADWIYTQLEAEAEYMSSDEAVDEALEAGEYRFDEDGDVR